MQDNAACNALGWNPDGSTTQFTITEPLIGEFDEAFFTIEVIAFETGFLNHFCDVVSHSAVSEEFAITCSSALPDVNS